jgi:hypothetical protein
MHENKARLKIWRHKYISSVQKYLFNTEGCATNLYSECTCFCLWRSKMGKYSASPKWSPWTPQLWWNPNFLWSLHLPGIWNPFFPVVQLNLFHRRVSKCAPPACRQTSDFLTVIPDTQRSCVFKYWHFLFKYCLSFLTASVECSHKLHLSVFAVYSRSSVQPVLLWSFEKFDSVDLNPTSVCLTKRFQCHQ